MAYIPAEKSIVAANLDKIRRARNLAFKNSGIPTDGGEMHLMAKVINFEKEIQHIVDTPDNATPGMSPGMLLNLLMSPCFMI